MPNRNDKNLGNAEGKFYVDSSCIDCDLCRENAPAIFRRDEEAGVTIVYHQPASEEELVIANEAMDGCPTESIGNDG
jgi:ferredoxin